MADYLLKESDAIKTTWMILEGLGYSKEENPALQYTVERVFSTCPKIPAFIAPPENAKTKRRHQNES